MYGEKEACFVREGMDDYVCNILIPPSRHGGAGGGVFACVPVQGEGPVIEESGVRFV